MATDSSTRVSIWAVLRQRSFLPLYLAEVQSIVGDQIARFALSVLVFDRTGSATAAALTYAVSFLPAIAGGILLAGAGDRLDRRVVMVVSDLLRAALFVVMTVPALSIGPIVTLLAVAVFIGPAFTTAEVSYLAAALEPEMFRAATGLRSASNQLAQVVGFAVGGVVVLGLEPRGALLVDAATFAVSALLVGLGLPRLVAAGSRATHRPRPVAEPVPVDAASDRRFAGLWRDPRTRTSMAMTTLIGLFVLPESLVVPFGSRIGASVVETGFLVAMIPLGSALGAMLILRVPGRLRPRVAGAMAVGCGLPLVVSATDPPVVLACVCWFASGVLAAYQVEAITALVGAIPEQVRSRHLGVAGSWLLGSQGLSFAAGGLLARLVDPGIAIAIGAGVGAVSATLVVIATPRMSARS